jgi:hypothetical protein
MPRTSPDCVITALQDPDIVDRELAMKPEARKTLANLHTLSRCENYLLCARAELASDPGNDRLRAFVVLIDAMVEKEKRQLLLAD